MRLKRYAIISKGEKTRWFKLTGIDDDHPDGTGWTLVDKFERDCIIDEEQADAFLRRPGVDPRYEKRAVTLTISKP